MDNAIDITRLKNNLPLLEARWQEKDDATLTYNAAVDAVAEETGISKPVLKKLVTVLKKEKAENAKAEADALSELIETLAH